MRYNIYVHVYTFNVTNIHSTECSAIQRVAGLCEIFVKIFIRGIHGILSGLFMRDVLYVVTVPLILFVHVYTG